MEPEHHPTPGKNRIPPWRIASSEGRVVSSHHSSQTAEGRAFPAGEDRTCRNWTSSSEGAAIVGHIDRKGLRDDACSQSDLRGTGGDGLFYLFRGAVAGHAEGIPPRPAPLLR
jgi:hypothetical protein